jgi:hypothetical protein
VNAAKGELSWEQDEEELAKIYMDVLQDQR